MHAPLPPAVIRSSYRPDIDGLRAIAVLSVLAYHYGAPIPGGFTGVDIFFVISGYLITARLAADISAGKFSLLAFYDRRIRRILPALLVMLAVTLFAGRFLLMPGDYKALATSTATAAFGVSNFYFLSNTGYFDQAANLMPQLHTWSLGVEEQFYLAWPPLLFLIAAGRKRLDVAATVVALVIIGFGASLFWFDADPKSAFYMVAPRAWELAIGAMLVFLPPLGRIASEVAMAIGSWLIIAGFVLATPADFPGAATLYPCAGAALVIWPRRQPIPAAVALGWLAPVGLISYSLYLWHWPALVYFRTYINNGQPTVREALALALVSVVLAAVSYLCVEKPFRKARFHPALNVWAGLAACMIVFTASMYVNSFDGMPQRVSRDAFAMRSLDVMQDWPCTRTDLSKALPGICTFGSPLATERAILWGDSNAVHLTPLVNLVARDANVSVSLLYPCPSIIDGETVYRHADNVSITPEYSKQCGHQRRQIFNLLGQRDDIKTVILAGSWAQLTRVLRGKESALPERLLEIGLRDTISKILTAGKKVVLIATIPHWTHDPVPCLLLNVGLWRRQCGDAETHLMRDVNNRFQNPSLKVMQRIASENAAVRLIVPADRLCKDPTCISHINGEAIYRDAVHFRRNLSETTNHELAVRAGLYEMFR